MRLEQHLNSGTLGDPDLEDQDQDQDQDKTKRTGIVVNSFDRSLCTG